MLKNRKYLQKVGIFGVFGIFSILCLFNNPLIAHAADIVPNVPNDLAGPSNLVAIPITATRINLEWPRVDQADGYVLYRSLDNKTFTALTLDATRLMFPDSGLAPSTTYYYKLTAQRLGRETNSSPLITISTWRSDITPPPQSLALEFFPNNTPPMTVFTWDSLSTPNTSYVVYRRTDSSDFSVLTSTLPGVTTYSDMNVGGSLQTTTYYYKVAGKNNTGSEGIASRPIYIRIPGIGAPNAPQEEVVSLGWAEEVVSERASSIQFLNVPENAIFDARKMMRFSYRFANTTAEKSFVMRRTVVDDAGSTVIERKTFAYSIAPQKEKTLYVNDWLYVKGKRLMPGTYTLRVEALKYPYKTSDMVDTNSFRFVISP